MENIQPSKKFGFLVGGFIFAAIYILSLTFCKIPTENREMANVILGVILGVCIKDAYSYLYGSTEGSQKKDATIAQAQQNISDAIAATPPNKDSDVVDLKTVFEPKKLNWLGSFSVKVPDHVNSKVGDAYVNTSDGKNYYFNGSSWIETTQKPS